MTSSASAQNNPFVTSLADRQKDWRDDALCAQTDPEAFFPDRGGSTDEATTICQSCDVREQCLQFALDNDETFGVWGGLTSAERRRLQKGQPKTRRPDALTPAAQRNRDIIAARTRGVPPSEVARMFGVSVSVVYRVAGPDSRHNFKTSLAASEEVGDGISQAV